MLHWLKLENPLYCNIIINFNLLNKWKDKFIPSRIANNIIQYPLDHTEKQRYSFNLDADNHEDNFQHAVDEAGLNNLLIISGCLYTDTDNVQEHLTSKFISAVENLKMLATWNEDQNQTPPT